MKNATAAVIRRLPTQALAIFWYLESRNSQWKTSGIKDEDIEEVNFCLSTPEERDALK